MQKYCDAFRTNCIAHMSLSRDRRPIGSIAVIGWSLSGIWLGRNVWCGEGELFSSEVPARHGSSPTPTRIANHTPPRFTQFCLKSWRIMPQSHTPVSLKAPCHLLDHKVSGNTLVPGVPGERLFKHGRGWWCWWSLNEETFEGWEGALEGGWGVVWPWVTFFFKDITGDENYDCDNEITSMILTTTMTMTMTMTIPRWNCRMRGGRGERELVPLPAQLQQNHSKYKTTAKWFSDIWWFFLL